MTDNRALCVFLLEQFARDEQSARAMPHAIANLQSRWSPAMLITDCEAKRRIVEEAMAYSPELADGDNGEWALDMVLRQLALKYAHLRDYDERWRS